MSSIHIFTYLLSRGNLSAQVHLISASGWDWWLLNSSSWPLGSQGKFSELIVLLYILDSRGPTKLLSFTQTLASLLTDLLDICYAQLTQSRLFIILDIH